MAMASGDGGGASRVLAARGPWMGAPRLRSLGAPRTAPSRVARELVRGRGLVSLGRAQATHGGGVGSGGGDGSRGRGPGLEEAISLGGRGAHTCEGKPRREGPGDPRRGSAAPGRQRLGVPAD